MMAMKLRKHVHREKPATHSVYEAGVMAETTAKMKVATQMGTQIHAERNYSSRSVASCCRMILSVCQRHRA